MCKALYAARTCSHLLSLSRMGYLAHETLALQRPLVLICNHVASSVLTPRGINLLFCFLCLAYARLQAQWYHLGIRKGVSPAELCCQRCLVEQLQKHRLYPESHHHCGVLSRMSPAQPDAANRHQKHFSCSMLFCHFAGARSCGCQCVQSSSLDCIFVFIKP